MITFWEVFWFGLVTLSVGGLIERALNGGKIKGLNKVEGFALFGGTALIGAWLVVFWILLKH